MDLIPITKIKMKTNKWLQTNIKYEEELYYNDIVNDMNDMIIQWILHQDDLEIITEPDTIKKDLIKILLPYVKK